MVGKILPCHQVRGEDGLVRISAETVSPASYMVTIIAYTLQLDEVIAGRYADKIKRYHIIDCRFDYEYAGGHIADAMNVNTHDALEALLLSKGSGIHSSESALPLPAEVASRRAIRSCSSSTASSVPSVPRPCE